MAKEESKEKKKRPTAEKRIMQSEKRRIQNKSDKSKVRTAVRDLQNIVGEKNQAALQDKLAEVYSLIDKGTKSGIYKKNKAARMKSRLTLAARKPV